LFSLIFRPVVRRQQTARL